MLSRLRICVEMVVAIVTTHYGACFIQTFLHACLGHNRRAGFMFREHLLNHHAIYSEFFTSPRYIDEDKRLTIYYLGPIGLCAGLAFWLLPGTIALAVTGTFLASLALHVYFHIQFHLERSVWQRVGWFRRRQFLHRRHHEQPNKNFGVLEPIWDRLLGTYADGDISFFQEEP